MAECIEREAVLRAVQRQRSPCRSPAQNRMLDCLKSDVIRISAADVAPVVHGRWIYDKKAQRPYCSVCKEYFYGATNSPMSYCSNCGAKMDGGNENV